MFHQIEKLQKMVNSLLGLLPGNGADTVPDALSASPEEKKLERLGTLILQAQDGELEHRYVLRMGKWLSSDPQGLRYYVDFQSLTALLYLHFDPERFSQNHIREQLFAAEPIVGL
jgi:hypothetical protein